MRTLAAKIVSALGSARSISLDVENISSVSLSDASAIQQQLQAALSAAGFQVGSDPAAATRVQVNLSRGSDGYLWVARIHAAAADQVVMIAVHPSNSVSSTPTAVPVLHDTLLFEQAEPILDFSLLAAPGGQGGKLLLVLEPQRIDVFSPQDRSWFRRDSASVDHAAPWPRDLRGQIISSAENEFRIFLPGTLCAGSFEPKLNLSCQNNSLQASPIAAQIGASMVSRRNYFDATLNNMQSHEFPVVYSIAAHSSGDKSFSLLAQPGGSQLFETPQQPLALFSDWGDDIASIAGCGDTWNVLATGPADWTKPDHIQLYTITGDRAASAGQPLEFSGPVLALWPSDDGKSARGISFNLQTGMYEASIITASCGK